MFSCSLNGMSSPYVSMALARFSLIVSSSSQCTSTGFSLIANSWSSVSFASTSMLPVDEPMNTFTPAMSSGVIPVSSSPFVMRRHMSSTLLFVAPIWKDSFATDFSFASSSFPFNASAEVVAGDVFGISMTLVTPPATAASDSVAISALCVSPGSRKCTCASIPPAITCLPSMSMTWSASFL